MIGAEVDDTPKHLYVRFGFAPVAGVRAWWHPGTRIPRPVSWQAERVPRRRRRDVPSGRWAPAALTLARMSHGQWFFVNLYEAVVRMPDRLADEHDSPTC